MKNIRRYPLRWTLVLLICISAISAYYLKSVSLYAQNITQNTTLLGSIPIKKKIDLLALAPNTGIAYGISAEDKNLTLFDLKNYSVKKTVRLDKKPRWIAVDSLTNIAYITAEDHREGLLYTSDQQGTLSSFSIPRDPQGIAIDPERKEAVIALQKDKELLVFSLNNFSIVRTINLPHKPQMVSLDTDSHRAVVVAGNAEEEHHSAILIVDLASGEVLFNLHLNKEIQSIAVDGSKGIATAVSEREVIVLDIGTGQILSILYADDAAGVDINPSTGVAVITCKKGFMLLDLTSLQQNVYSLQKDGGPVAVDKFKNTALIGQGKSVVEVQLPNPLPEVTTLTPKSARIGDPGFTLKIAGKKFITTSTVKFNNTSVDTTFKDNNEIDAAIPASLLVSLGTVSVTVTNPAPAGGTSAPSLFTVLYPAPLIASLSPNTIAARSADFTLTATGSQFMPGDVVTFNGQSLQTTYINTTTLNAVVSSSFIQTKGLYLIAVITPDGASSNPLNFTVTDTYPVISGFSPTAGTAGTLVTIVGSNFNKPPVTVLFNGIQAVITSLSDNAISALVPSNATTGLITVSTALGKATSPTPFTVSLKQDYALLVSPSVATIQANGQAAFLVSLVDKGAEPFSGLVKLSVPNSPSGVTAVFNSAYVSLNQPAMLTLASTQGTPGPVSIQGAVSSMGASLVSTATIPLNAQTSGATTLSGQILASKDAKPVPGVTMTMGSLTAQTDAAGNFTLTNPPVGSQILIINGDTANHDTISYPSALPVPVNILSGASNSLPYPVYLHEVKTSYFTQINPLIDTIVTDPEIPNYEMRIPAGTVITGWDGQPNTKVSVKPIPIDRLPIKPPPPGVYAKEIYMYYFFKPGGGTPSQPIPVKMPNTVQATPGTRAQLWYYDESFTPDPNSNQWKPFGMGSVSSDGRNIIPDPGVGIPKFCCGASFVTAPPSNVAGPPDGTCPLGDPIDPFTGAFTYAKSDIGYPSPSMLSTIRFYNSGNPVIGPFGKGTSINYDHYLQGSGDALAYTPPEGGNYIFSKNADGYYTNINYPFLSGAKAILNADGTRILKFKNESVYTFDANGRLVQQRDNNDNWVKISRDSNGNITDLDDNFGREIIISHIVTTAEPLFYTLISSLIDMNGREVRYSYNSNYQLSSITQPDGSSTIYSYDSAGRIITITNPRGIVEVTNQYDASGRVIQQTHADGGVFNIAYNVVGGTVTQTAVTAPNGGTTAYRLNGAGYSSEITDAYGQKTTYDRAFSTNVLHSVTDPLGRTTTYAYDVNGNTTSVTDPVGNVTTYEYDPVLNKPTKITDALGDVTTLTYDGNGNLVQILTPKSELWTIAYNSNGQPISITDPLSNITSFTYDELGNLIKATDPLGNTAQMLYDFIGRIVQATDPKGKTTLYAYDNLNRLQNMTDALNNKTSLTYDANGNLLTVTDAKNQVTTYTYTVRDKVASVTDPLSQVESYVYDQNDNLTSLTDRKGQTSTYQYDLKNRLTIATYTDSSTNYTYDVVGRLTDINDSISGLSHYDYSNTGCAACGGGAVDKIIQEISQFGSISYTYDAIGRRSSMTVAGQPIVNYNYDADSQLTNINTIISGAVANFNLVFDASGRRTSLTMPNGVTTTYGYDTASRLLNLQHVNPANAVLESLNYTYDPNYNRTSMNRAGVAPLLPGPVSNSTYNADNQMLTFNDKTISYDSNGNTISATNTCGTTNYTWDARNRLIGMNGFAPDCSALAASFTYDAWGRRTQKTINGNMTQYLYDGLNVVQEIKGGTVYANYIRTQNIDESLARVNSDGTVRYYHMDALGSVITLTDESGVMKTQYSYDPYGNTSITGEASDNPFQYTGRENDGTGLYYYRARYYNPELQRFISKDPIGFAGGINLYAYVGNNPVNQSDPLGLAGGGGRPSPLPRNPFPYGPPLPDPSDIETYYRPQPKTDIPLGDWIVSFDKKCIERTCNSDPCDTYKGPWLIAPNSKSCHCTKYADPHFWWN